MSLPRLRLRAGLATFAEWRGARPGLGLPSWLELAPESGLSLGRASEPGPVSGRPVPSSTPATSRAPVPPLVGAALDLYTDPEVTVLFAVHAGSQVRRGCMALGDRLVSVLVRSASVAPAGSAGSAGSAGCLDPAGAARPGRFADPHGAAEPWMELALVPVERAADEVLRWVPARPAGDDTLELQVLRADDAASRWMSRWAADGEGSWCSPPGTGCGGPVRLASELRVVLGAWFGAWHTTGRVLRETG